MSPNKAKHYEMPVSDKTPGPFPAGLQLPPLLLVASCCNLLPLLPHPVVMADTQLPQRLPQTLPLPQLPLPLLQTTGASF